MMMETGITDDNGAQDAHPHARFEWLTGRFIDGLLTESEDRELVAQLEAQPEQAKRFLRQMGYERLMAAISDTQRMNDGLFIQAVQRSIHLLNDNDGNERFAKHVVALVRGQRAPAGSNAQSSRRRPAITRHTNFAPWAAVAGIAALVALVVFFALPKTNTPTNTEVTVANENPGEPTRITVIDLAHYPMPTSNQASAPEDPRVLHSEDDPEFNDIEAHAAAMHDAPLPNVVVSPQTPGVVAVVPPTPSPLPSPQPRAVVASRPETATLDDMGRIKPATGCTAVLRRAGIAGGEMSVRRIEVIGNGDVIRVGPPESTPSDVKVVAPSGVEVLLTDGTLLFLKPNTSLRMQRIDGAVKPLLESGEVVARVKPQPYEKPLVFLTSQGPEAKVVGTILRVQADPQGKKVNLFVEEGKVQFTNKGESRLVLADEGCIAEDGKAPTLPFLNRPRPGQLAGLVADREKNAPVENALVIASPMAQGNGPLLQYKARTDAQGRYQFDALPDGPAFVYVVTEEGESRGIRGRGTVARTRVAAGEKTNFNVMLDKAMLVEGRVTENGKALSDYRVRLVRQGSDGLSFNAGQSGTIKWLTGGDGMDGFTFVALEGAGRYSAIVEKKGLVAKLRGGALNDLRSDRVNQWFIDASFTPSAIVKIRLQGPNGATITDDTDTKLEDPRRVRSVATLKGASGPLLTAVAEPNGTLTFDTNLESGAYDLRIERFGFQPETRRISVVAGKTLDVNVPLKPNPTYRK